MQAEILSIGTELLLGDILNTNARYLAQRLADMGIFVYTQTVVGDNPHRLKEAFENAFERSDIVITTGGLGPTKDDITKETAGAYFGKKLVLDEQSLKLIEEIYRTHNWVMAESNKKQAYFPEGAIILKNDVGTAPGCIIQQDKKMAVLLPGPSKEMKNMFEHEVVPHLIKYQDGVLYSRVLHLCGIGESTMAEAIEDIIDSQTNPTVAPYAKENDVTLRLTARGKDIEEAKQLIIPLEDKIRARLGEYIYAVGDISLEEVVGKGLIDRQLTIAVAESCTGGMLVGALVNCPGISDVLIEGVVSYSNESKIKRLNVKKETLEQYGAVSAETAEEMARGIALTSGADIGIATTGVAGPEGGTPEKPVGLVYIGLYNKGEVKTKQVNIMGDRNKIRKRTVIIALDWLRRELGL